MQSRNLIAKAFKRKVKSTIRKTTLISSNADMTVNTYFRTVREAQEQLVKRIIY